MKQSLPPFSCSYSPNIPELLFELKCAVAISTYQAGKLIFISSPTGENMVQLPRNFLKPMGIAINEERMALATQHSVMIFENAGNMAHNLPSKPNTYDTLYLPRTTYHTGALDIHDLMWDGNSLIAVNTIFSCLCRITDKHSFEPIWQPSFIDKLAPVDACHLNGLAIRNEKPAFVSALGSSSSHEGWRKNKSSGGVIIDIESNEIVCSKLAMPHSPRVFNNELYCLLSATGELVKVDTVKGVFQVVKSLNAFARGMDKIGDYVFIGLSKIRKESQAFNDLPISKKSNQAGVVILHLPTLSFVGSIIYQNSVDEIYDVKVLENTHRPTIFNTEKGDHKIAVTSPMANFWTQPKNIN